MLKLLVVLAGFSWLAAAVAGGGLSTDGESGSGGDLQLSSQVDTLQAHTLQANNVQAQTVAEHSAQDPVGYLGRIELNDPEAIAGALRRAEDLYHSEGMSEQVLPPVVLVIHGSEVEIFFKENYSMYKSTIDLAAKLAAFKVVEIRVCEASARRLGLDTKSLFPFVGTVPYGPAEITRLIEVEQYVYF